MSSTIAEFNTHSCYPIYGDPVDFTCDYTMHNRMMSGYLNYPVERDEDRFFINLFMFVHIAFFSVFISSLLVANFVWYPMVKDGEEAALEEEEENKPPPVIPYEKRYPLASNNVNRAEMLDASGNFVGDTLEHHKELINSLILENVPDHGSALFRYNSDKNGFEYWANRHIPHRYLRAIARKYVNTYKCYELYIDEESDEEKKEREEAEKVEQDEPVLESEKEETTQPITLWFIFKDFCSWFIDYTFQQEGVSRKHYDYPMVYKIVKYMIMDENWVPRDDDEDDKDAEAKAKEEEDAKAREEEEAKAREEAEAKAKEDADAKEKEEEEESVFATFKNYKMSSKNKLNSKKGVENNKEKRKQNKRYC